MIKHPKRPVALGALLVLVSFVLYLIHYAIFHDLHHIMVFLVEDIAFIPIHVLIITLIIERLLTEREKLKRRSNLNMVVGVFFNEVGTPLLNLLLAFDEKSREVQQELLVDGTWSDKHYEQARKLFLDAELQIDSQKGDLEALRHLVIKERDFLLQMLENPSILEYEYFTNLLLAVFHLSDELAHRETVQGLPPSDYEHLSTDIERAYRGLILEWLKYMRHLKKEYPYLFSLAVRLNPFDSDASPIVKYDLPAK